MADDEEEDFTFPATITNPPLCLLESPPLWPPVGNKHGEGEDEWKLNCNLCDSLHLHEFKRNTITFRENFCYVDDDKEEKMDILWEDLNEKFSRKNVVAEDNLCDTSSPGRNDDHVQVCCVKLSKANGDTISWKKGSILVLIRFLLKKSFAMHHDSAASIKKLEW